MEVNSILQQTFIALAGRWAASDPRCVELWQEIATHYQHRKRHYHNQDHLNSAGTPTLFITREEKKYLNTFYKWM